MTFSIRQLHSGSLREVVVIERQAFPDDPWTLATAGGWLARVTLDGQRRYAAGLARLIRFSRLNEAVHLVQLVRLVAWGKPASLCYLVAEADGAIAGYARFNAPAGGEADIQTVAVRAARQGEGIGAALLTELTAISAARGCCETFLYVRADNSRARRFYLRSGFIETGVKPGYYQPSGTDAIVMHRHISSQERARGRARTTSARTPRGRLPGGGV